MILRMLMFGGAFLILDGASAVQAADRTGPASVYGLISKSIVLWNRDGNFWPPGAAAGPAGTLKVAAATPDRAHDESVRIQASLRHWSIGVVRAVAVHPTM